MAAPVNGEIIWYRTGKNIGCGVFVPPAARTSLAQQGRGSVQFNNWSIPWLTAMPSNRIVHRVPTTVRVSGGRLSTGPVYAILAGGTGPSFEGSRLNFRDIMQEGKTSREFVYVLPAGNVTEAAVWQGYVRVGYERWLMIPCPRPESVYNRVPTRQLERTEQVIRAKQLLERHKIPLFNPDYFNKAIIYQIIAEAGLKRYLPESSQVWTRSQLKSMVRRHGAVYLKPNGGSVGHGILRVSHDHDRYELAVLKDGRCARYNLARMEGLWKAVNQHRLKGAYTLQAGKSLLTSKGRQCDFRVLAQKGHGRWQVTGRGVRVAGPDTITTHVPNGGYILDADSVLQRAFGNSAANVSQALNDMIVSCATAIDGHYNHQLGEMSMDIGIDCEGRFWFFEANSKPMKFDEPDIRKKSLRSVLQHLNDLRRVSRASAQVAGAGSTQDIDKW